MNTITGREVYAVLTGTEGANDNRIPPIAVPDKYLGSSGNGYKSGFTFGHVQLDIGNNPYASDAYTKILNLGLSRGVLSQKQFDTLAQYNGVARPDIVFAQTYGSARALANNTVFSRSSPIVMEVDKIIESATTAYLESAVVPSANKFLRTHSDGVFSPSSPDFVTAISAIVSLKNRSGNLKKFGDYLKGIDDPTIDDVRDAWQAQLGNGASSAAWKLVQIGASAYGASSAGSASDVGSDAYGPSLLGPFLPPNAGVAAGDGVFGSLTLRRYSTSPRI